MTVSRVITKESPIIILPNLMKVDFTKSPTIFGSKVVVAMTTNSRCNDVAKSESAAFSAKFDDPRTFEIRIPEDKSDSMDKIDVFVYAPEVVKRSGTRYPALYECVDTGDEGLTIEPFAGFSDEYMAWAEIKSCAFDTSLEQNGYLACSLKLGLAKGSP